MKQDKIKLIMTIACICFAVLAVVFLVSGLLYGGDHAFTKIILFDSCQKVNVRGGI